MLLKTESKMKDKKFHKAIAEAVKQLRKENEVEQTELAAEIEVHVNTIQRIEAGTNNTSAEILKSIAEYFEIKFSEMIKWAGY